MIGALAGILLREVPAQLVAGVPAHQYKVYGSIIRSVTTGRIVGHLQETSGLAKVLLKGVAAPASLPLQGVDLAVNAATLHETQAIKAAVGLVQSLQVANLALGAVGIGVSVAGFAVLSRRIGAVEAKVDGLGDRLDAIARSVHAMRRDALADLFTRLRTVSEQMDEGWSLADPAPQWRQVATEAHTLGSLFHRRASELLERDDADPEVLEPLLEATALASGTRVTARLAAGDDLVARRAAEEGATSLAELGGRMNIGRALLTRLNAGPAALGSPEWGAELKSVGDRFRAIGRGVRDREVAAISTASVLEEIGQRGISGRDWLQAAREETESPLLFLPTHGRDSERSPPVGADRPSGGGVLGAVAG